MAKKDAAQVPAAEMTPKDWMDKAQEVEAEKERKNQDRLERKLAKEKKKQQEKIEKLVAPILLFLTIAISLLVQFLSK